MTTTNTNFKVKNGLDAVGTITGLDLVSTASSGNEGGEIRLATPATGTTLTAGSVTIDVYQNKLRFFETGGTTRGAYIDLTAATTGVGSNLLTGGGGGSGTVTSITAGTTGLTGGTITSSGTIDIDTSKVPLLASANTFTGITSITNTTTSTNSTTGALKVTGGVGVAENLNVGGSIYGSSITAGTYLYTDSINAYSSPSSTKYIYYSLGSGTIYLGGPNSPIIADNSMTAGSFVKSGGTSSQFLMADGSTSTGGGFVDYQALTLSYR